MAYPYILEASPILNLDNKRFRVKQCPCGKKNTDGKFVPFKNFVDKGFCHSCGELFRAGNHICPQCKQVTFNRYVDKEKKYLAEAVGKCLVCNYHYSPAQYINDTKEGIIKGTKPFNKKNIQEANVEYVTPAPLPTSFIPLNILKSSLDGYSQNHFAQYLCKIFGAKTANKAIGKYFIGTSKHWNGSTVFWQIDAAGKIRAGKIMLYDETTGKRIKQPYSHITWVHKVLKMDEFNLKQCFFGEHLLAKDYGKRVAIVESEKTAVIASIYLPQFIWLACGSLVNLKPERFKILSERNVTLFPDLNGFAKWSEIAKEIHKITTVKVSDVLEKNIKNEAERKAGLDIADYLLKYQVEDFQRIRLEPINILINKILYGYAETIAGKCFENMRLIYVKTDDGNSYDVLLNADGNPISQQTEAITRLAIFFNKDFKLGLLDNEPCFISN